MTVARRLWIALGLNFVLLVGVAGFQLRTTEQALGTAHDLADVSTRLVLVQTRLGEHMTLLDASAAKFAVTGDRGYLAELERLCAEFSAELAQIRALAASPGEVAALISLEHEWTKFRRVVNGLAAAGGAPLNAAQSASALAALRQSLERLSARTGRLGVASRDATRARIAAAEDEGARAERIAWIAALLAVLLAAATVEALRRSITRPLHDLSRGAREVAAGRFDARIELRGGSEFTDVEKAFNVMTAQLRKFDRLKQDFVATVSHDLKSPLASLRETTSLLLDEIPGPLAASQRRVLLLQRESADRLGRMIAKLLELSRLDAAVPVRMCALNPHELIGSAVAHANAAAGRNEVRVTFDAALPAGLTIDGDEDGLRQLLDNLLENAVKFSPAGAEVEVSARITDGRLMLFVSDRGPGIPVEYSKRIFERFYQTPAGRAVAGRGAGLGLAICREVVRTHGGRVSVEARAGGGSIFAVSLPCARRVDRRMVRIAAMAVCALVVATGCAHDAFERSVRAGRWQDAVSVFRSDSLLQQNAAALRAVARMYAQPDSAMWDPRRALALFAKSRAIAGDASEPAADRGIESILTYFVRDRDARIVRELALRDSLDGLRADISRARDDIAALRITNADTEAARALLERLVARLESDVREREAQMAVLRDELDRLKQIDLIHSPPPHKPF